MVGLINVLSAFCFLLVFGVVVVVVVVIVVSVSVSIAVAVVSVAEADVVLGELLLSLGCPCADTIQ